MTVKELKEILEHFKDEQKVIFVNKDNNKDMLVSHIANRGSIHVELNNIN